MGKRLIQQRRGRGSIYRSPGHRYLGKIKFTTTTGKITDIKHAPGRTSPVAVIDNKYMIMASRGMKVGDNIKIKPLKDIPEGTKIYNIELVPGDGGKLCRASGMFATMITRDKSKSVILLPSKKKKTLNSNCLAVIGTIAGAGRKEKPILKAGKAVKINRAFGRLYPHTSGVAMNAVDHPFGGTANPGKHKTVSRNAPPGRKVGSISAKRMGRRKK